MMGVVGHWFLYSMKAQGPQAKGRGCRTCGCPPAQPWGESRFPRLQREGAAFCRGEDALLTLQQTSFPLPPWEEVPGLVGGTGGEETPCRSGQRSPPWFSLLHRG